MKSVRIRLVGGPPDIPLQDRERTLQPEDLDDHVRVPYLAGYEHFFYAGADSTEDDRDPVRQYQWCYRTRIAE